MIPCQSNMEATLAFKSSSVSPGGCSPRSHHCVMRCQGKCDNWSLMAPRTQGGWGSLAISSEVTLGDLQWAKVTLSEAQDQGEDKHLLRGDPRASGAHTIMKWGTQLLQVLPWYCVALAPPEPSWRRVAVEKTELVTPQSTARHRPAPALLAMLL